jgi:hypothetical protein
MIESGFEKRDYLIATLIYTIPGLIGLISSIVWWITGGDPDIEMLGPFALIISIIFIIEGTIGFIVIKFKDKGFPGLIKRPLNMLIYAIAMYIFVGIFIGLFFIFQAGGWPFTVVWVSFCLASAILYTWLYFQKRKHKNPE